MTPTSLFLSLAREEWRAHPWRMAASVLAIALGVALGFAVHLINRAALAEFSAAVRHLSGQADLELRGGRAGFDETLLDRIAAMPDVAIASPVVEGELRPAEPRGANTRTAAPIPLYGVDVFAAGEITPALVGVPAGDDGGQSLLNGDVFLSPAAAAHLKAQPGDELTTAAVRGVARLRVAGALPLARSGQRYGALDIAAAQRLFGLTGRLSRIDVRLKPGASIEAFLARLAPLLPAGVVAATPADAHARSANLSRAYRVNLSVLGLVALFTGAFLVFSKQALSVVRRRSLIALLRVLGLTRAEVGRQIRAEGLAVGIAGGALGVALGYASARVILPWVGGDLGGGYFAGVHPELTFDPWAAALAWMLAAAVAWLGSAWPAREAVCAQPARALKAGGEEEALERLRRPWAAALVVGAGVLLAFLPPVAGLPVGGYAAIACLLVGGLAATPTATRLAFARLARRPWQWLPLQLAAGRLVNAPGQVSIALAGILASFSLVIAMAVMVGSFRTAVERWLTQVLPAELYVRVAGNGSLSEAERRVLHTAADRTEFARTTTIVLDARRPAVALIARPIDLADAPQRLPLTGTALTHASGPPAWISEAVAQLYGLDVGDRLTLPLSGREVSFTVAGVWRDYARQFGAVVVRATDYRALTGDASVSEAALWPAGDQDAATLEAAIRSRLAHPERLEFAARSHLRTVSLAIFDRSFAVTYVLEAAAIAIGLFGIAAGFSAQVLARTREFGMLRHIGLTRREVLQVVGIEGLLVTLLGAAMGLAWGLGISLILIHVVNPQSFHWTMEVDVPWLQVLAASAALVATGSITAVAAARGALHADVVRSVRDDW